MDKYVCDVCGYVYDPEVGDPDNGVEPGTAWEDVPEDWVCPLCGVGKDSFSAEQDADANECWSGSRAAPAGQSKTT